MEASKAVLRCRLSWDQVDHDVRSEGDKTGGKRGSYHIGNLFWAFFRRALGSHLKGSEQENTPVL